MASPGAVALTGHAARSMAEGRTEGRKLVLLFVALQTLRGLASLGILFFAHGFEVWTLYAVAAELLPAVVVGSVAVDGSLNLASAVGLFLGRRWGWFLAGFCYVIAMLQMPMAIRVAGGIEWSIVLRLALLAALLAALHSKEVLAEFAIPRARRLRMLLLTVAAAVTWYLLLNVAARIPA